MSYLIGFIILAALLFVINFVVTRLFRNTKENYDSMLSNSETSDAEDRKKNDYIFFPKDM